MSLDDIFWKVTPLIIESLVSVLRHSEFSMSFMN